MAIKNVGVVGCGLMGAGIVEVCARAGYEVTVMEVNDGFLNAGLERVRASLQHAVDRQRLSEADRDAAWKRIGGTTSLEQFDGVDLAIEAIRENLEEKREVFAALDGVAPPHAILASNTSSLPLTELAAAAGRPEQVLGLHFFNPAPVMPLLELVRPYVTSDATFETARAFAESLGKTVVVAKDTPGFIVNALLVPFLLDAARMFENGVASREDIDAGVKLGLNHPMGPLTLLDFIGIDTALSIADAVFEETKDTRFAAPVLLRRMVALGHWGKKSGRGFYDYKQAAFPHPGSAP